MGVMKRRLIGICGKARHGKSTAADYLREFYGYRELSFAEPMKRIIVDGLLRCPPPIDVLLTLPTILSGPEADVRDYWNHRVRVERTPFTRWLLQFVGTEIGRRGFSQDVWVEVWERQLDLSVPTVAPDMRFSNEAAAIKKLGGEIWRVVRMDAEERNVPGVEHGADHVSETEALTIKHDVLIEVPSGIENVHEAIDQLMGEMA